MNLITCYICLKLVKENRSERKNVLKNFDDTGIRTDDLLHASPALYPLRHGSITFTPFLTYIYIVLL